MRCLFTTVFAVIGLVSLVLGAFLLYTSFIDSPESKTATLGGASLTQDRVAAGVAGSDPDWLVVQDGQASTTLEVGQPVIESNVLTELQNLDSEETIAIDEAGISPELTDERTQQASAATENATTDIGSNVVMKNEILTADSEVSLFSLNTGGGDQGLNTGGQDGQGGFAGGGVEQRVVEFEWPKEFRSGESGVVRVTLKALPQGGVVAVAEIPTNAVVATPIILTDCYNEYDARVSGKIIATDFDIESTSTATQVLTRGSEASWRWTLSPKKDGTFVFTVALSMQWTPRQGITPQPSTCAGLAANSPFTFWGQSVQVEVNKVFGLVTIQQASIVGTVFALLGFVGQVPFLNEIVSILFERKIERRAERRRERQSNTRRTRR